MPKAMFFDSTDLSTPWTGHINLMIKSRTARLDTRRLLFKGNKMKEREQISNIVWNFTQ